jgi:glucose/mannose-6-phosphate isomerase
MYSELEGTSKSTAEAFASVCEQAEEIADLVVGKSILLYSDTGVGSIATRWRQQLNENSKLLVNTQMFPEMNHNEIVAWATEGASRVLIVLTSEEMHPRTQARVGWLLDNIESEVVWRIECEGESLLERLLYAAHVTDWGSIALALVNGINPSEMAAIDSLKAHLDSIQ